MEFKLTKPCSNCPFLAIPETQGWLGESRAADIAEGLLAKQQTFTCHKTNGFDADGQTLETHKSQHCAGALIMLEKMERPNQMMRWMERLGHYDRTKLDRDAPVVDDDEHFIEHHS